MLVICKNISILRIYEKQRSLKTLPCRRHYSRHSGWYKTVSFIPGPKVLPGLCVRPHGEVTNTEQLLQILKQAVQLVSATGVWEKPLWQVPSWVVPWRPRYALIGLSRGDVHGVPKKRVCVWGSICERTVRSRAVGKGRGADATGKWKLCGKVVFKMVWKTTGSNAKITSGSQAPCVRKRIYARSQRRLWF